MAEADRGSDTILAGFADARALAANAAAACDRTVSYVVLILTGVKPVFRLRLLVVTALLPGRASWHASPTLVPPTSG
ncbi:MAG: hypothetical protein LT102_14965 [Burkholderiaceae bacterium]|nr:hypothetical protein [Burkholderiaceae bacterium]